MNAQSSDSQPGSEERAVFFANKMTKRQKLTWGFGVGVIGAAVFLAGGSYMLGWPPQPSANAQSVAQGTRTPTGITVLPVRCMTVKELDQYEINRRFAGVIEAAQESELGFVAGGRVESIQVDDGFEVEAQATLAALDIRPIQNRLDQIKGQLHAARARLSELEAGPRAQELGRARSRRDQLQASLDRAKATLKRREVLAMNQATSDEELDQWKFDVMELEAQVAQAEFELSDLEEGYRQEQIDAQRATVSELEASLQQAELDKEYATLKAPFAGVVVERRMDPGEIASAGQTLCVLQSLEREVRIGFPADVAKLMKPGDRLKLEQPTGEVPIEVSSVLPQVNQQTRTQGVIFRPVDSVELDPVGTVVRVAVSQPAFSKGFWIPASALAPGSNGLWAVLVVSGDEAGNSVVRRRDVDRIHLDNDRAFVQGTLVDGDQLVVDGHYRLVPNQQVEVLPVAE